MASPIPNPLPGKEQGQGEKPIDLSRRLSCPVYKHNLANYRDFRPCHEFGFPTIAKMQYVFLTLGSFGPGLKD